ncbi:MAG: SIMPL domain-containing protein [Chloroflexia bacterium]
MKIGNSRSVVIASAALSTLLVLGTIFGAFLLARGASPAAAQSVTSPAKPAQITVVGTGSVTVKPDVLKVTIGVSAQEDTVAAAQSAVTRVTNNMVLKLKELGISESDYAISQYNVEPVMDYNDPSIPSGTLTGFRVVTMYDITFRDTAKAPAGIDALTGVGANTIYSTYYTVSNTDQLTKQAYADAMKDAQDRAEKVATLSNLSLGKIVSVSEVSSTPYSVPVRDGMGGGDNSFAPGQQTVSSSLIVTYEAASK